MSVLTVSQLPASSIAAPAGPTWAQVGQNLWVASTRSEFVGTVERIGERYIACDAFAVEVGRYDDFDAAKRQVLRPSVRRTASRRRLLALDDTRIAWVTAVAGAAALVASLAMFVTGLA